MRNSIDVAWAAAAAALLFLPICVHASDAATAGNEAKVTEAVRTMYAAYSTDDIAKFHSVAAADFYAYDGGQRYDGDELMEFVKKLHAEGKIYEWNVTEPKPHIEGNMAWVTWVTRGSLTDAQTPKMELSWLDSAVLRREKGEWRIAFFNSSRAKPK